MAAKAVILATGPVGRWVIPAPFEPLVAVGSPLVLHTEALLAQQVGTGATLSEEITRRCPGGATRVLVIGGGISAAQAALAAFRAGHRVVLRSRRPLRTRAFDVGSEWLDVRTADRLRFDFLCLPMRERRRAVREATPGGSVPANYMDELHRLARQYPAELQLEVDDAIESSAVEAIDADDAKAKAVAVNGEAFAMVILATGVVASPSSSPLYQSISERFGAPTVEGLPRVGNRLRWLPHEDIFVLGANAVLELGPGGANLMGAMRGARIVSHELAALMGKAAQPRPSFSNMYAAFGDRQRFGEHENEIDVLAQQLNLSPQAETALRKAQKKGKKVTKGLKSDRDPLEHLYAHTRRQPYT